ncbi:MAG: DNA-3-methyladenine glycosylase 2 family protein [Acidobacteria bacterium]|nr:DNA-3-methyladenine glycosylase 2 family protein [Acidobacteriota bacterium]
MKLAVAHLQANDRRMAALIEAVGPCRMRYSPATYETVARSIVSQQLSNKAASTIYGRLLDALGSAGVTPHAVLKLSHDQLRSFGLSAAKSKYLHGLAHSTLDGTLDFNLLPKLSDDDALAHLCQAKGVGVWTAQMFLIFALRRRDILPTGDAGVRGAMRTLYRLKELPTPEEMVRRARPWRPYASIASWYLWSSLELKEPV